MDIVFSLNLHTLKQSSLVDIDCYNEGDFSINFPVDGELLGVNFPVNGELSGVEVQFASRIAKGIVHNFLQFRESWDICISPHLSPDFHNVVVFDKMNIDVYKEIGGTHVAYVMFKWVHMKCKFSKEKAVENRLYECPHETFTVAVSHGVTSYTNLIELCKPVARFISPR